MKNKKQNLFAEKRFIFMGAEMQNLAESEVADVKKRKEADEPELDTKALVDESNAVIGKYTDQLKILPDALKTELHDEIVKYFKSSPGRFDKNTKTGLNTDEFKLYKTAMVEKVKELMKDYAPTAEDIEAMKKTKEQGEAAGKAAENLKPLDVKDIKESPGEINDLNTLGTKFEEYNGWNQALQKEGSDVVSASESVQKAYQAYKKSRDGIKAYKKFKGYLWPEDDKERLDMKAKVDDAQKKVDEAMKKFEDTKGKLKTYGEALRGVSDKQKDEKLKERDEAIKKVQDKTNETKESKEAKEKQFKSLTARQNEMIAEREGLETYSEEVSKSKDAAENRKATAELKKGELSKFDSGVQNSLKRIDEALQEPGISEDDKKQLEETKQQLLQKQSEVGVGLKVCNEVLESETGKVSELTDEEKAVANRSLALKSHLEEQVSPTIGALNKSIATLEDAKMKFATTEEQVNQHYENAFTAYDNVDKAVDNAVLKNNLANEKIYGQLSSCKKSLSAMDTKPPDGFLGALESTIGIPFSMAGGAISEFGAFCLDQATYLSKSLESSRNEMGTFSYLAARIGVELISTPIGVAGGLLEMGGGIVNMVAHPIDTAKGLGTLVGLNPDVSAGTAWKEMGKAIISWEDFKEGRIGVGIGKVFTNIVTTVTGASAVGAGGKAAQATYIAARTAGKGVAASIGKAVVVGGKVMGTVVAEEAIGGAKNLGKGVTSFAKAAPEALTKLPGVAVDVVKSIPSLAAKTPGAIAEFAKAAPGKAKAAAELVGKSFKSVGEGLVETTQRIFTADGRANAKLAKVAKQEGIAADALQKGQPKYQEFQETLQKMREENPGVSDADLRLKFAKENPKLYTEGFTYEGNIKKFEDAQKAFETEIKQGLKGEELEKAQMYLDARKNAQKGMIETSSDYAKFNDAMKNKDPKAEKAFKDFQEAMASGDVEKVKAVYSQHLEYSGAFAYIEHNLQFQAVSEKVAMTKVGSEISDALFKVEFASPEAMAKYANDFNKKYPNLPKGQGHILGESNGYALVLDNEGKIQSVKVKQLEISEFRRIINSTPAGSANAETIAALESTIVSQLKTQKNANILFVNEAIKKGLIAPSDRIISAMVDYYTEVGGQDFFKLPGVNLTPNQQLTLLDSVITKRVYNSVDKLPIDYADPAVIEKMGTAIDNLCGNPIGLNKAEELVVAGKAPITERLLAQYFADEANIAYLETLLEFPNIKLSNGMSKEQILEKIVQRKQYFEDTKFIRSFRDPQNPGAKTALRNQVVEAVDKIKAGQSVDADEMGKLLLRLKERDPAGFEMLMQSDAARLVNTECFDGIVKGNKIEHIGKDGQKVTIYVGKELGKGGMGIVFNGAFYRPGEKGLTFGAYKQPHVTTDPRFWLEEIEGAKLVESWNHPNIMKPLDYGADFIIYETGEKATDLWKYLYDPKSVPTEYFSALRDVVEGLKEYRKPRTYIDPVTKEMKVTNGYAHYDLKEGNVLRIKVGVDAMGKDVYVTKIIDNTPVSIGNATDFSMPRTPGYTFEANEMTANINNLVHSYGLSREAAISSLGAGTDPRALSTMLRNGFERYVPNWESNPALFTLVNELSDPAVTSNPKYLHQLQEQLTEVISDMLAENIETFNPEMVPYMPKIGLSNGGWKPIPLSSQAVKGSVPHPPIEGSKTPVAPPPQFISDFSMPSALKPKGKPVVSSGAPTPLKPQVKPVLSGAPTPVKPQVPNSEALPTAVKKPKAKTKDKTDKDPPRAQI